MHTSIWNIWEDTSIAQDRSNKYSAHWAQTVPLLIFFFYQKEIKGDDWVVEAVEVLCMLITVPLQVHTSGTNIKQHSPRWSLNRISVRDQSYKDVYFSKHQLFWFSICDGLLPTRYAPPLCQTAFPLSIHFPALTITQSLYIFTTQKKKAVVIQLILRLDHLLVIWRIASGCIV